MKKTTRQPSEHSDHSVVEKKERGCQLRTKKKTFLSLTSQGRDCTFAACGKEIAFKILYHFRPTPCNNNKKHEAMTINTLQKPPPNRPLLFDGIRRANGSQCMRQLAPPCIAASLPCMGVLAAVAACRGELPPAHYPSRCLNFKIIICFDFSSEARLKFLGDSIATAPHCSRRQYYHFPARRAVIVADGPTSVLLPFSPFRTPQVPIFTTFSCNCYQKLIP